MKSLLHVILLLQYISASQYLFLTSRLQTPIGGILRAGLASFQTPAIPSVFPSFICFVAVFVWADCEDLGWLLQLYDAAAICTDSQFLQAIQSGSADTANLGRMLKKRAGKTTLLWIPGHYGNAGNKNADACDKQMTAITGAAPRPISFTAASALMRRTLMDLQPSHCRTKEAYTKTFTWPTNPGSVLALAGKILLYGPRQLSPGGNQCKRQGMQPTGSVPRFFSSEVISALQLSLLCGSSAATLGHPFPY